MMHGYLTLLSLSRLMRRRSSTTHGGRLFPGSNLHLDHISLRRAAYVEQEEEVIKLINRVWG